MNVIPYIRFASALVGPVSDMLKALYERHGGNVAAATAEIKRITDYGARGEAAEREMERELAETRRLRNKE